MALRLTSAVWDTAQTFDAFALSVNRRAYYAVNLPSMAGWVRTHRTRSGGDAVRAGSGITPWPRLSEWPGSGHLRLGVGEVGGPNEGRELRGRGPPRYGRGQRPEQVRVPSRVGEGAA